MSGYSLRLLISDAVLVLIAVAAAQLFWSGIRGHEPAVEAGAWLSFGYTIASLVLWSAWMLVLLFFGTRDPRLVGSGLEEYGRVAGASLRLFGVIAIVALLFRIDLARGYIITAFPVGVILVVGARWCWRQWLRRERRRSGKYMVRILVVGSMESVDHLMGEFRRRPYLGFDVVGACYTDLPSGEGRSVTEAAPLGTLAEIPVIVREQRLHAVALAGSEGLPASTVRKIAWELESTGVDLMVAPAITDVAGPRIHTRPVGGLPLIYVESPSYEAGARVAKSLFDFGAALALTFLASPVLLIAAIAVATSSKGPVLFKQPRIGLNGKVFHIYKFRSMREGADAELAELLERQGTAGTPLFKVEDDPRITRVGRILRKYSIDELPQLFNVLRGDMSLVGPRPQRAEEVALYDPAASRRLLVKPGITGLWQISGRSDLSWEDAIRWDLYYVENWSLIDDMLTLIRTVGVVLRSHGAR